MPYSITSNQILFFFKKDVGFIFLVAAAEDYTTKSIRQSLIRVRILRLRYHVTANLPEKKRKSSFFIATLHYNAVHTLFIVLHIHAHITRPHSFIASISKSKSYVTFQYSHVEFKIRILQITSYDLLVVTDNYIVVIYSVVVTSAVIDITRSLWFKPRKHEID